MVIDGGGYGGLKTARAAMSRLSGAHFPCCRRRRLPVRFDAPSSPLVRRFADEARRLLFLLPAELLNLDFPPSRQYHLPLLFDRRPSKAIFSLLDPVLAL